MLTDDIRAARRSKGLSQAALGQSLGLDQQVIKRIEIGVGTLPNLLRLMDALSFHLSNLARGRNLPEQLRQRRANLRLSIAEVAERAGMSPATVAALERGQGSIRSLMRLLEVIAPHARHRPPTPPHWSPDPRGDRDHQFTPPEFLTAIYESFGAVDLDPCAHAASPVEARRKFILDDGSDGLRDPWSGPIAFVNPPYSAMLKWLRRANEQWRAGHVDTVVALVPARTDSSWFHDHLITIADIYLLKGRLRFLNLKGRGNQAPFPLMVVFLGARSDQMERFANLIPGTWLVRQS